jgi:hypothetical protein
VPNTVGLFNPLFRNETDEDRMDGFKEIVMDSLGDTDESSSKNLDLDTIFSSNLDTTEKKKKKSTKTSNKSKLNIFFIYLFLQSYISKQYCFESTKTYFI